MNPDTTITTAHNAADNDSKQNFVVGDFVEVFDSTNWHVAVIKTIDSEKITGKYLAFDMSFVSEKITGKCLAFDMSFVTTTKVAKLGTHTILGKRLCQELLEKKAQEISVYQPQFTLLLHSLHERFYNSTLFDLQLKYPKTLFNLQAQNSAHSALIALATLDNEYGKSYNCVKYSKCTTLSTKSRVALTREADAFVGITISCTDPKQIKSVTLFIKTMIPTDTPEHDLVVPNKIQNFIQHIDSSHPHSQKPQYPPIKTVYNPTSNHITFFPHPLLLSCGIDYSIHVDCETRFPPDQQPIYLEYLMVENEKRKTARQSFQANFYKM